jgi:hypothetical protein
VYTLFGPPTTPYPLLLGRTSSTLFFAHFVEEKTRDIRKIAFLLI